MKFRGSLPAYQARDMVWEYWNHTLGAINVETPDPALNMITNGWLVYQTMAARLWAEAAFISPAELSVSGISCRM